MTEEEVFADCRGKGKITYLVARAESGLQKQDCDTSLSGFSLVFERWRICCFSIFGVILCFCVIWCFCVLFVVFVCSFFCFLRVFCVKLARVVLCCFFRWKRRSVDHLMPSMPEEPQIAHGLLLEDGIRQKKREKTGDAENVSEQDREKRHGLKSSAKCDGQRIERRRGEGERETEQERRARVETDTEQNRERRENEDAASRSARRARNREAM